MSGADPAAERIWWRTWRALCLAGCVWLAACGWLARPLPPWVAAWAAWWNGDSWAQQDHRNHCAPARTGRGGCPGGWRPGSANAGRSGDLSGAPAGAPGAIDPGWLDAGETCGQVLAVRISHRPELGRGPDAASGRFCRRASGRGVAASGRERNVVTVRLLSGNVISPVDRWIHLACSTDGKLVRLSVDGQLVGELWNEHASLALARLQVGAWPDPDPNLATAAGAVATVVHDDLVLFDRILSSDDVNALAAAGEARGPRSSAVPRCAGAAGNGAALAWRSCSVCPS